VNQNVLWLQKLYCIAEHKTFIDQSRFEVYYNNADSQIVWQSHHFKDHTENHRSEESKDGEYQQVTKYVVCLDCTLMNTGVLCVVS